MAWTQKLVSNWDVKEKIEKFYMNGFWGEIDCHLLFIVVRLLVTTKS